MKSAISLMTVTQKQLMPVSGKLIDSSLCSKVTSNFPFLGSTQVQFTYLSILWLSSCRLSFRVLSQKDAMPQTKRSLRLEMLSILLIMDVRVMLSSTVKGSTLVFVQGSVKTTFSDPRRLHITRLSREGTICLAKVIPSLIPQPMPMPDLVLVPVTAQVQLKSILNLPPTTMTVPLCANSCSWVLSRYLKMQERLEMVYFWVEEVLQTTSGNLGSFLTILSKVMLSSSFLPSSIWEMNSNTVALQSTARAPLRSTNTNTMQWVFIEGLIITKISIGYCAPLNNYPRLQPVQERTECRLQIRQVS